MASNALSSIYFFIKDSNLNVYDLPSDKATQDADFPDLVCEVSSPNAKFINCKYREIRSSGNVSLESCTVGKVNAAGNAILCDSSITDISANEVAILGSFKGKTVTANRVFTNQVLSGVRIDGEFYRLISGRSSTDRAHMLLPSKAEISGHFFLSKNIATVTLDGGFIKKDVVFPEDSVIPAAERQVILINGGRLDGTVIRGNLVDLNQPEESDSKVNDLSSSLAGSVIDEGDLDVQSLADNESVVGSCPDKADAEAS